MLLHAWVVVGGGQSSNFLSDKKSLLLESVLGRNIAVCHLVPAFQTTSCGGAFIGLPCIVCIDMGKKVQVVHIHLPVPAHVFQEEVVHQIIVYKGDSSDCYLSAMYAEVDAYMILKFPLLPCNTNTLSRLECFADAISRV